MISKPQRIITFVDGLLLLLFVAGFDLHLTDLDCLFALRFVFDQLFAYLFVLLFHFLCFFLRLGHSCGQTRVLCCDFNGHFDEIVSTFLFDFDDVGEGGGFRCNQSEDQGQQPDKAQSFVHRIINLNVFNKN